MAYMISGSFGKYGMAVTKDGGGAEVFLTSP